MGAACLLQDRQKMRLSPEVKDGPHSAPSGAPTLLQALAANPYAGQSRVLATVWLHGHKLMLRAMLAAMTRLFVCGGSSMRYLRR